MLMQPVPNVLIMVIALRNWPTSAMPGGPMMRATTFTDTKPVIILMIVESADHADTRTKSLFVTFAITEVIFFNAGS